MEERWQIRKKQFHLKPFSANDGDIEGQISRGTDDLEVIFSFSDGNNLMKWPNHPPPQSRREGLWEQTCFEVFIKPRGKPQYWEFNLAPTGHWECYRFTNYRQQRVREQQIGSLVITTSDHQGRFTLKGTLPLNFLFPPEQPLDLGLSAVIVNRDDEVSYWALSHFTAKPDFHNPKTFVLQL